ncbi:hypothetical protein [Paraflavitalea speifideaquila]|uniref:response regulator transcription factor n=1 Tax=Paraflavitalea speifideaquila TaxID=3076558 RepID=UPI0028E650ED|nr:hypothetical protein [Paraflavitalea speifideiaquila]
MVQCGLEEAGYQVTTVHDGEAGKKMALGSTDDKVVGFDAGAVDYLAKPFEMRELLARLKAWLKRSTSTTAFIPFRSTSISVLFRRQVLPEMFTL